MRIVIDMQGAQTESRFRGIGRYTMAIAKAIARNRGSHELFLALNGLLLDSIKSIRVAFEGILSQENILVWYAPGPVKEQVEENSFRREVAEMVRESFIASLRPDLVIVTSLFEGYVDDAVTSIGKLLPQPFTAVILYDLIPLLNPDTYLENNPVYKACYVGKIEHLKKANLFFAISESSAREGCEVAALDPDCVINISTACEEIFHPMKITDDDRLKILSMYKIDKPFILYTGGADPRKNLSRLIEAFARLPTVLRENYQMVLAGNMPKGNVDILKREAKSAGLSDNCLVFTGYIEDSELARIYNLCKIFVLPSFHEGFGLPALEAMSCGAPVIGSNTTSVPEVIGKKDAMFDPFDVVSISDKITQTLEDNNFRATLREHCLQQARSFSWDKSAKMVMETLNRLQTAKNSEALMEGDDWTYFSKREELMCKELFQSIAFIVNRRKAAYDVELREIAFCIEKNLKSVDAIFRRTILPERIKWRIEGPFDSSYSLALVNREIARALAANGHEVVLHSTEGPGDFPADEKFLLENPDLANMHKRSMLSTQLKSDITSRNLYPPRVEDMSCRLNLLHAYGWEESGFPYEWVEYFNCFLHGITVMSKHVQKILIDNGVTVPISVCGVGVDHYERVVPTDQLKLPSKKFRFLHVSSCFPRKGANAMIEAYSMAFRASDNVAMVIKTFPNPHNEIHSLLDKARSLDSGFPEVHVISDDYTDSQMKALYKQCHALVAPSKAEGFGLPMAEAMISGLPVITTNWSGQLDFCNQETAWVVDYSFERSETHLQLPDSVCAAPDISHLARVMREVYETPTTHRDIRISAGRKLLLNEFRWTHVAGRLANVSRVFARLPRCPEPSIGWVTTWGTPCGIATYSKHLVQNIPSRVTIFAAQTSPVMAEEHTDVIRCWRPGDKDLLDRLRYSIAGADVDTLVIQFNYGFFHLQILGNFIIDQINAGMVVVVMMHSTIDPAHVPHKKLKTLVPALAKCHRVLVHALGDLNRLKSYGLVDNVTLFPHGIIDFRPPPKRKKLSNNKITISSYGFFLPQKGLLELIDAVALLRDEGMEIHLHMVNAEYPIPESSELINLAKQKISSKKLEKIVDLTTEFLPDEVSLKYLYDTDLIVFPYQDTGESASGAVRYGLTTGRPVAVTPIPIFEDVFPATFTLPGNSPNKIAEGIRSILNDLEQSSDNVRLKIENASKWREVHKYSRLSRRLFNILQALARKMP